MSGDMTSLSLPSTLYQMSKFQQLSSGVIGMLLRVSLMSKGSRKSCHVFKVSTRLTSVILTISGEKEQSMNCTGQLEIHSQHIFYKSKYVNRDEIELNVL